MKSSHLQQHCYLKNLPTANTQRRKQHCWNGTDRRKRKYLGKTPSQWNFVHCESHTHLPGIEPGLRRWDAETNMASTGNTDRQRLCSWTVWVDHSLLRTSCLWIRVMTPCSLVTWHKMEKTSIYQKRRFHKTEEHKGKFTSFNDTASFDYTVSNAKVTGQ